MREAKLYTAFGQSKTLREWALAYAVSYATVYSRIRKGEALETALEAARRSKAPRQGYRKDFEDLTGETFGYLTVESHAGIKIFPSGQIQHNWWCRCVCKKLCQATSSLLKRKQGPKRSCGCMQWHGKSIEHQGEVRSLRAWCRYYEVPYHVLSQRLRSGMTFDDALRMPSQEVMMVPYDGETRDLMEWASKTGISYSTLRWRYRQGWSAEQIIGLAVRPSHLQKAHVSVHLLSAFGDEKTLSDWCKEYNLHKSVVALRMVERGMTLEEALIAPKWYRHVARPEKDDTGDG